MARHTVRLQDYQSEGLEQFADKTGMSKSDVMRIAMSRLIDDDPTGGEIDEWIKQEAVHDRVVMENRPSMRMMHFKQNVFEYLCHECLRGEDGALARFPPQPDMVEETYIDSLRKEIKEAYPEEHREEYLNHLDQMLEWYKLVHPDTKAEDKEQWLFEMCLYFMRWQSEEDARDWIDAKDSQGQIPETLTPHEILDEARDAYHRNRWKDEYDEAARGKL